MERESYIELIRMQGSKKGTAEAGTTASGTDSQLSSNSVGQNFDLLQHKQESLMQCFAPNLSKSSVVYGECRNTHGSAACGGIRQR